MLTISESAKKDLTISWLLEQANPGVRYWTFRDLLGRSRDDPEVIASQEAVANWRPVSDLLREQRSQGYWVEAEDVYWPKWSATVWQLILLAEMGMPSSHPAVRIGCEYFLKIMDSQDRSWPPRNYPDSDVQGQLTLYRSVWEPCVTGNMARTLTLFGFGEDPRVREMYDWLVRYQLPDGGWNCESGPWGKEVHHSSFMSTVEPLWAFSALDQQHWPKGGREAMERGAEFMLMHRLYKSDRTGKVINEEWTKLHFPMFYFYDILHGLRILTALGYAEDERMKDALQLLLSKRQADGTWPLEANFLDTAKKNLVKDSRTGKWEVTRGEGVARTPDIYRDLGSVGAPNPWITLNALRVLKARE